LAQKSKFWFGLLV